MAGQTKFGLLGCKPDKTAKTTIPHDPSMIDLLMATPGLNHGDYLDNRFNLGKRKQSYRLCRDKRWVVFVCHMTRAKSVGSASSPELVDCG